MNNSSSIHSLFKSTQLAVIPGPGIIYRSNMDTNHILYVRHSLGLLFPCRFQVKTHRHHIKADGSSSFFMQFAQMDSRVGVKMVSWLSLYRLGEVVKHGEQMVKDGERR